MKDRAPFVVLIAIVTITLVLVAGELAYRDLGILSELP